MSGSPTSVPVVSPAEQSTYPLPFTVANDASLRGRRRHPLLVHVDMLLLVAAAAVVALRALIPALVPTTAAATCAAVFASFSLLAQFATKTGRFDREWIEGRAVAEAVKTATWRYMMLAVPFDGDDRAADALFVGHLHDVLDMHQDLRLATGRLTATIDVITPHMRQVRALPLTDRKDYYLRQRVTEQLQWYALRAQRSNRARILFFRVDLLTRARVLASRSSRLS